MGREFDAANPPEGYLKKESLARTFEMPGVKIHNTSTPEGFRDFMQSLAGFISPRAADGSILGVSDFLDKAQKEGVFTNQLRMYWDDLYRVDKPEGLTGGLTKEQYIEQNATWENANVVEYSWKQEGRFVVVPKEEDYFRGDFSRQEFVFSQNLRLSREKRGALRRGKIKIGGLGVGGAAGYLLVLSGAQNIDVIDPGVLPPHKFNRFIGADTSLVGQPYVVAWGRAVLNINPYLHLGLHHKKLGYEDGPDTIAMRGFMDGGDVMVEEVDSFPMKELAGEVAEELGMHLVMASDVEKTSVLEVKRPGARRWKDIPDGERRKIRTGEIRDFPEATALANAIIGREHIPGDLLTIAAELGYDFWPQDAGAAFLSAKAVRDAIVAILSGKEEIWGKTVFEERQVE